MKSKHFFAIALIFFISSCSAANSDSTPQNVDAPNTALEVTTTSTSVDIKFSSDPQEALDQLAEFDNAVDQSRISEGSCGKFALTVGPKGLRSYKWQTDRWTHLSGKFETEFDEPYLITTRNFNYRDDGVKEFLVNFDQDGSSSSMFGAILTLTNCDWDWAEIETPNGVSKTIRYLSWNDDQSQFLVSLLDENSELPALIKYAKGNFWVADYKSENSDTGYGETSGSCQDPTSGMLVNNGASIKYSDGTRTCVNGKWSNPSGSSSSGSSSQTTKKAVKLICPDPFSGENLCRIVWSDGKTTSWLGGNYSGNVVDVFTFSFGGGRYCIKLYENGGTTRLLC